MKIFRAIAAVAFLAVISAGSVLAQVKPSAPAGPAPTQTGALPDTKIALVNTDEFADEKTGIARLVSAMKRVDGEFQPRRTELQTLQGQIEKARMRRRRIRSGCRKFWDQSTTILAKLWMPMPRPTASP